MSCTYTLPHTQLHSLSAARSGLSFIIAASVRIKAAMLLIWLRRAGFITLEHMLQSHESRSCLSVVNFAGWQVAQMLVDAKCGDVSICDLRETCDFADFFLLSTGRSHRHVFTAASAIVYQVYCFCCKGSHPLRHACFPYLLGSILICSHLALPLSKP